MLFLNYILTLIFASLAVLLIPLMLINTTAQNLAHRSAYRAVVTDTDTDTNSTSTTTTNSSVYQYYDSVQSERRNSEDGGGVHRPPFLKGKLDAALKDVLPNRYETASTSSPSKTRSNQPSSAPSFFSPISSSSNNTIIRNTTSSSSSTTTSKSPIELSSLTLYLTSTSTIPPNILFSTIGLSFLILGCITGKKVRSYGCLEGFIDSGFISQDFSRDYIDYDYSDSSSGGGSGSGGGRDGESGKDGGKKLERNNLVNNGDGDGDGDGGDCNEGKFSSSNTNYGACDDNFDLHIPTMIDMNMTESEHEKNKGKGVVWRWKDGDGEEFDV